MNVLCCHAGLTDTAYSTMYSSTDVVGKGDVGWTMRYENILYCQFKSDLEKWRIFTIYFFFSNLEFGNLFSMFIIGYSPALD
jgi:hypothetical protein